MKLTETERLMLINQNKILALLDPDEKEHHERLVEILESGYEGLYDELTMGLREPMSQADSDLVIDVLNMHVAIRDVAQAEGVDIMDGDNWALQMRGFDGNNEYELLSFARFIALEDGSSYGVFLVGDQFPNSHSRSRETHERMLTEFNALGGAVGLRKAGVAGLERLKAAAVHPENR